MGSPSQEAPGYFIPLHCPESDKAGAETVKISLEDLLTRLDFQATADLTVARRAVLVALAETADGPSHLREAWTEYEIISHRIVDNVDVTDRDVSTYNRTKLALDIHKALILRDADQTARFIGALDESEICAQDNGFYDVALALEAELRSVVATSELSPESLLARLKGTISEPYRKFLRDDLKEGTDLKYLIGEARDLLVILDDQRDPDDVLAKLGIIEPTD